MTDRNDITRAMLDDPFERAAARVQLKYPEQSEYGRRLATPSAVYDQKYFNLPSSDLIEDSQAINHLTRIAC